MSKYLVITRYTLEEPWDQMKEFTGRLTALAYVRKQRADILPNYRDYVKVRLFKEQKA